MDKFYTYTKYTNVVEPVASSRDVHRGSLLMYVRNIITMCTFHFQQVVFGSEVTDVDIQNILRFPPPRCCSSGPNTEHDNRCEKSRFNAI